MIGNPILNLVVLGVFAVLAATVLVCWVASIVMVSLAIRMKRGRP